MSLKLLGDIIPDDPNLHHEFLKDREFRIWGRSIPGCDKVFHGEIFKYNGIVLGNLQLSLDNMDFILPIFQKGLFINYEPPNLEKITTFNQVISSLRVGHQINGVKCSIERFNDTSFFGYNLKNNYIISTSRVCHAGLKYDAPRNIDTIVNAVCQINPLTTNQENFYYWLLNYSPWSEAYVTKDVKEGFQSGINVRTDLSNNYVVAACMMTRFPTEWKSSVDSWNLFIEHGIEGCLALLLSINIHIPGNIVYLNNNPYWLHVPLQRWGKEYLYNMRERKYPITKTYRENPTYGSPCSIWVGTEPTYYEKFSDKIDKVYRSFASGYSEVGPFKTKVVNKITKDNFANFCSSIKSLCKEMEYM